MKTKISIFISLFLSFIIFLSLSQMMFNYIFQNEPYFYYGSFPIENKNLMFSKTFPQQAKAVLVLEDDILKVYLPKDNEYFDLILKDIKSFLYDISIKLNKIVKPYFIEKKNLKFPDIYDYYIKILRSVFYSVIFFSGWMFSLFDKNNLKLFFLHYYKEISIRFLIFLSAIILYLIPIFFFFSNYNIFLSSLIYALSAIFIVSIFENIYLNLFMYIVFGIINFDNIIISNKIYLIILFLTLLINFIFNYISIFITREAAKIERNKRKDFRGIERKIK
ncbi:hypothetical protein XO12_04845 [Marinitoga sp. 1154]|uniref:hypothetical protein n=1 Tax=Marinitoga sp. 1154 TaxID=1643335 RepID=UPI00158616FE|nr:hypothetical protein [Marinitoga sp. 1154]NUU99449.1 hypothetical protein [Marinitoga sp. 1154]